MNSSILLSNNISFMQNDLMTFPNWDLNDSGLTVTAEQIIIPSGKKAGTSLVTAGLFASSYRLLELRFLPLPGQEWNVTNKLEALILYEYSDGSQAHQRRISANITKLNTIEGETYHIHQCIMPFPYTKALSVKFYILNNTGADVTILASSLRRSKDTDDSQITGDINLSISLQRVVERKNIVTGLTREMDCYFDKQTDPVNLKFMGNSDGKFIGIMTNDSRFIPWNIVYDTVITSPENNG